MRKQVAWSTAIAGVLVLVIAVASSWDAIRVWLLFRELQAEPGRIDTFLTFPSTSPEWQALERYGQTDTGCERLLEEFLEELGPFFKSALRLLEREEVWGVFITAIDDGTITGHGHWTGPRETFRLRTLDTPIFRAEHQKRLYALTRLLDSLELDDHPVPGRPKITVQSAAHFDGFPHTFPRGLFFNLELRLRFMPGTPAQAK